VVNWFLRAGYSFTHVSEGCLFVNLLLEGGEDGRVNHAFGRHDGGIMK
jgi:hypothetical protein